MRLVGLEKKHKGCISGDHKGLAIACPKELEKHRTPGRLKRIYRRSVVPS